MRDTLYLKALKEEPSHKQNWLHLIRFRFLVNKKQDIIPLLHEAISLFPQERIFHLLLVLSYIYSDKLDIAREILLTAPPPSHENTSGYELNLEALLLLDENIEQSALELLKINPTHDVSIKKLSDFYRKNNQLDQIIPICKTALAYNAQHATARYELAAAYTLLGRDHAALQTLNFDQCITFSSSPLIEPYARIEEYKTALINEIMSHPTLQPDPFRKTTVNGLQTELLYPQTKTPCINDLLQKIQTTISQTIQNHSQWSHQTPPKQVQLNAWAVVYSAHSYQRPHYHPGAWISGVYYVNVPRDLDTNNHHGSLALGTLEMNNVNTKPPWGIKYFQPKTGSMILFPSYIPHQTIPTNSDENRICIAFNVVPTVFKHMLTY